MRILKCSLENFASYKELDFIFKDQGLTLIQGPTGAGKSTLCDAIPWVLFGKTAKGGAVDEVISWPGDKITIGVLELSDGIGVTRIRGPKPKDNDLYMWETLGDEIRGKDITDTQRLINQRLGMDCDIYLAGAYFHEFSQTSQFFNTSAKNRRSICENLVDLSLAQTLQENLSEEMKSIKHKLIATKNLIEVEEHKLSFIQDTQRNEQKRSSEWTIKQETRIKELAFRKEVFEREKEQKISQLNRKLEVDLEEKRKTIKCSECGANKTPSANPISIYSSHLEIEKQKENPYVEQLKKAIDEENPYKAGVKDHSITVEQLKDKVEQAKTSLSQIAINKSDINTLQEVVSTFRSSLVSSTISFINENTNFLLQTYFDGEFRVEFSIQEEDKLEVSIFKQENTCSYAQLSKGQRQILKLCFGISVMRHVSNHHPFPTIFLDEAFDGLDETMKNKVYRLLQSLEIQYENVFVVEHSNELKSLFNNQINVNLINGQSVIEKA